eukprot:gene4088-30336_t
MPWCNATLSIDARAADMGRHRARIMMRCAVCDGKIPNLDSGGAAIASLGLP